MKHRPIGLGVQGLADVFIKMRHPFDSDEARAINREIFETIYYAALCCSCDLAAKEGQRNLEYCNSATTDGNQQCGLAEGLYANLSSEQVQGQWTHPYMAAPGVAGPGAAQGPGCEKGAHS